MFGEAVRKAGSVWCNESYEKDKGKHKGAYELAKNSLESKSFGRRIIKRGCHLTYDTALILTFFKSWETPPLTPLGAR